MEVDANCYVGNNSLQRHEAGYIMAKYATKIQWRSDGNDAVLELGSGTGDITNDFILPVLPAGFKKLVGTDVAEDMVEVANKKYCKARVSFEQWDMCGDTDQLLRRHPEGFDHIFSFFAIHWLRKPELAFKNSFDLLCPNGDCLLIIVAHVDYIDVEDTVLAMPKWSKLIPDPIRMPMPYRYFDDPEGVLREQLRSVGFKKYSVVAYDSSFTFNSLETTKGTIAAVNGNLRLLTTEQIEEYFLDFLNTAAKMGLAEVTDYPVNVQYTTTYKMVVAYARK